MAGNLGAKLLDALVYGVAVATVVTVLSGVVVLATGGGWVALKVALFLVGFLLFGYSSIALWRGVSPEEATRSGNSTGPGESRQTGGSVRAGETGRTAGTDGGRRERSPFESALARYVPPLDDLVPVGQRFPPSLKLFVASLVVLGLSLALEVVFGVGVE